MPFRGFLLLAITLLFQRSTHAAMAFEIDPAALPQGVQEGSLEVMFLLEDCRTGEEALWPAEVRMWGSPRAYQVDLNVDEEYARTGSRPLVGQVLEARCAVECRSGEPLRSVIHFERDEFLYRMGPPGRRQKLDLVMNAACPFNVKGYLKDRGKDFLDILSFCYGIGIGAKARAGPVQTGLLADYSLSGLRGGEFAKNFHRFGSGIVPLPNETLCLWFGNEDVHVPSSKRLKSYAAEYRFPFVYRADNGYGSIQEEYYSELEVVLGLGLSLRLGANPGELLDFLLGFAGVDLYEDDVSQ